MNKNFLMFFVAFIMFVFTACEEDLKNTGGEGNYKANYDVEANENEMHIHNGYSQLIASFKVLVDTDYPGPVYLKSIVFHLASPDGDISNELAFYEAFDNFLIGGRGEPIPVHRISAYEFMVSQPIRLTYGEPLVLDIFADVNTPKEFLSGIIKVTNVTFGDTYMAGVDYYHWESIFAPNLGESATSVDKLVDGDWAANWQFPTVRIENCNEFEVQLEDGSCVYDNCRELPNFCGYGECRTDLQNGRMFCECDLGFSTTPNSTDPACNYYMPRYDMEFISPNRRTVHNGSSVLLAEWNIFTIGGGASLLRALYFRMEGAQESFSSFQVTVEPCFGAGQVVFWDGETAVQNDIANLPYSTVETIDLMFLGLAGLYDICPGGAPMAVRVYGEVHGNPGDSLIIKVESAAIYSSELFFEDGFPLGFEPDSRVGTIGLTSLSFVQSKGGGGYSPYYAYPVVTIE